MAIVKAALFLFVGIMVALILAGLLLTVRYRRSISLRNTLCVFSRA